MVKCYPLCVRFIKTLKTLTPGLTQNVSLGFKNQGLYSQHFSLFETYE